MKSVVTCVLFALLYLAGASPAYAGDPFVRGRGFASSFGSSFRQESFSSSQFSAFDDGGPGGYCGGGGFARGGGFAADARFSFDGGGFGGGFRNVRSFSFRQESFSAPVFRPPVRQRGFSTQFGFSAQFGRSRFGGCP